MTAKSDRPPHSFTIAALEEEMVTTFWLRVTKETDRVYSKKTPTK